MLCKINGNTLNVFLVYAGLLKKKKILFYFPLAIRTSGIQPVLTVEEFINR